MNNDVIKLKYKGFDLVLVGTNHISKDSSELVKSVIESEKPDFVCIEWDEKRFNKNIYPDKWQDTNIVEVIKTKQFPVLMFSVVYRLLQKYIAKHNGGSVGGEMIEAVKTAEAVNAEVVLIDRDSQVTFKRAWRKMGLLKQALLPYSFGKKFEEAEESENAEEELKQLLASENFEIVFERLKDKYPSLWETFVTERDDYLATKIQSSVKGKAVVVIGKGHLKGVSENIEKEKISNIEQLETIPDKKLSSKIFSSLVPIILIALLAFSFYQGTQVGLDQLTRWLLWNGGLAALFTVVALGHPLSILTSFIFAPLATLLPIASVGVFSAIVEGTMRRPRVSDFETIDDDIKSIKTVYKNRVLRVFLVFVLSSIGSSLGNLVGGLDMIKNIF